MPKFRSKPVEKEAIQWTGKNLEEIFAFTQSSEITNDFVDNFLEIPTLEGVMKAQVGDWIIKGLKGEFYPCKPEIFEKSYEPVVEGA